MSQQKRTVLIVEDNRTNLMLMEMLVKLVEGCQPLALQDPLEVIARIDEIQFDIAIIDLQMPGMDGISLIRRLRAEPRFADRPMVVVTADSGADLRIEAIEAGAVEFLHKPLEPVEFKARIRNLVRLAEAQSLLADRAAWLKAEVDAATAELRRREEEIIARLTLAAGYKDPETATHTVRMARYCALIAHELGLTAEMCRDLQLAAPMHDIGKVGIRDDILLKQGRLDPDERAQMNEHAMIGGRILAGSASSLLQLAATIAETHHERWDGAGYPRGLAGEVIPLPGRIAAIADVFDALTTERPYKPAWTIEQAVAHISAEAGRHFDPRCVEAFRQALPEIMKVKAAHSEPAPAERQVA